MSSPSPAAPALKPLTRWLVLAAAAIGFLFDTYELLMFPVIGSQALAQLLDSDQEDPDSVEIAHTEEEVASGAVLASEATQDVPLDLVEVDGHDEPTSLWMSRTVCSG